MRRLFYSLIIGFVVGLTPVMLAQSLSESGLLVRRLVGVFMYPGYLVAMAVSMGRVDDINFTLLEIANVVFYSGVTYLFLIALAKFGTKAGLIR